MSLAFAWSRKLNIGIVLVTFSIMILTQIPILFHLHEFTALATEKNSPFLLGSIIGISLGLTAANCILDEQFVSEGKINYSMHLIGMYLILFAYFFGYFAIFQHVPNYVRELRVNDFLLFFWSQIGGLFLAFVPVLVILERKGVI